MTEKLGHDDLDPRKLSDIKLGMIVEIEDLGTEKLVKGKIILIISTIDHPEGILVKLDNKSKGHVKKIINATIESQPKTLTKEVELLPESFNLEYKRSFKAPEYTEKNNPEDIWIPSFNVYKAITGFANAEGGRLVLGVEDIKNKPLEITGLKNDFETISKIPSKNAYPYSNDQDGMQLRLIHEFAHYFPKQELVKNLVSDGIKFFGEKPEKMICIIDVHRSTEAVILYDKAKTTPEKKRGPNFYVRVGNQTVPYEPYDFCRYWARHLLGMLGQEKILFPN